jgi:hypothetical protein
MQNKEKERIGVNRFISTGYVCANCDTDYGINEYGMNLEDGVHSTTCPVCGCPVLRVYYFVNRSDAPFPSPTMCAEVLDLIQKEKDDKIWTDFRIPADGHHGIDCDDLNSEFADEEQAGCGGCGGDDDDDCCDGKECCCQTRGDYCIPRVSDLQKAIEKYRKDTQDAEDVYTVNVAKLDAQVLEERKHRKKEFERVLKFLRNPAMEE